MTENGVASTRCTKFISRNKGKTRAVAGMIMTTRVMLSRTFRPMNSVSANP